MILKFLLELDILSLNFTWKLETKLESSLNLKRFWLLKFFDIEIS